jgi:glycosyltransferase involved in cell wall biosynthesis
MHSAGLNSAPCPGSMKEYAGSMKRVLILVENLPVPLDRRVWQEACALRDAGYEVSVICPKMRGYVTDYEVLDGIVIHRHWISEEAKSVMGFCREYLSALWGQMRCALRVWRESGFNVIHYCNPPDLLCLVALPYKLLAGVKLIYDVHDLCPEMFQAKFPRHRMMRWVVRKAEWLSATVADAVLATNQSVRSAIRERCSLAEGKVTVVRTAPHAMSLSGKEDPSLRNGRRYLVGYVGVMGSTDGVRYLLEAAHHLVKKCGRNDIQFHLMGSGPEYDSLLQQRDALGLVEHVCMPGRVSHEHLCSALQTMDLGVACDPRDSYNDHCTMNKTLEYMAFGKAQVMFGTTEGMFSAGESALCVMENSAVLLAEGISELLADEPRRAAMGAKGKARLQDVLSWEKSVQHLLAAYRSVLGR